MGKTILITGASAGIGEATAREFAAAANGSLKLILTARRVDKLDLLRDSLLAEYPELKVLASKLDVTNYKDEIPAFIKSLPQEFSEIDVLVNNAGLVHGVDKVGEIKPFDIDVQFNTNVLGLISLTQNVLVGMKQRNRGDIVNMGSIAGRDPYPGGAIYCATKAAVSSFSHTLRKELIDTRIRVFEVQPGAVETEFSKVRFYGDSDKAANVYKGTTPLDAQDIAEVIVFGCSRKENTVIAESLVFPSHQASASHVYRRPE
ncbi:hypothetical protein BABINDRAFT_159834, partial [Babjeviella inositovora NRRL Y-12698]